MLKTSNVVRRLLYFEERPLRLQVQAGLLVVKDSRRKAACLRKFSSLNYLVSVMVSVGGGGLNLLI